LWDGNTWHLLKNYTNSSGDIHWTSQELDVSAFANNTFKIRFRAYGDDSYDINNWNIDNIRVIASEVNSASGVCLAGYSFYLDNILCGFTPDTSFLIPSAIVQFGHTYNACVTAVYGSGPSNPVCESFSSRFLEPPVNLQGSALQDTAVLSWNTPQGKKSLSSPPGLIGYRVYRDGALIGFVTDPDSLSYKDFSLFPSTYSYGVSALYDLTSYGFPGTESESLPAGPVSVAISYGVLLPFYEPWNSGSFSVNGWSFDPGQGNWIINSDEGNPAPCAEFASSPALTDYSFALESPVINTSGISCSKIWLDFDVKLTDLGGNSTEELSVELFYNGQWNTVFAEVNSGSHEWTSHHIDISAVKRKACRLRFRAHGPNSANINGWDVDNIYLYSVCKPARDLAGEALALDVRLTWNPPVCPDGSPLAEGFEESGFPPPGWTRRITNSLATWVHSDINYPVGVHSGNWAARVPSDYAHQDEWLIAENVEITGDLEFWSFGFQGSVHNDHYYVKLSRDEGVTWETLLDLSALPPYPSVNGYNQWEEPYIIDLSGFLGEVADIAWQIIDGDGQGAWYTWAIDDCTVGGKKLTGPAMRSAATAYDIFRQDPGSGDFVKVNPQPVSDTTFLDPGLEPSPYLYFVVAMTDNCQYHTNSDTVLVDVVLGNPQIPGNTHLKIFPNPANDYFFVTCDIQITRIEMFDYLGRPVNIFYLSDGQVITMNSRSLPSGIYFLKLFTNRGFVNSKVIVQH
jgi:hypothetical protein